MQWTMRGHFCKIPKNQSWFFTDFSSFYFNSAFYLSLVMYEHFWTLSWLSQYFHQNTFYNRCNKLQLRFILWNIRVVNNCSSRYGQHVKTFTDYDARDLLRLAKDDLIQMVSSAPQNIESIVNSPGRPCGRGPAAQRSAHETCRPETDPLPGPAWRNCLHPRPSPWSHSCWAHCKCGGALTGSSSIMNTEASLPTLHN